MVLLYIDRHGGHIFTGFEGAIDYQDLFWFFGHPVVYVMFFPYLGAAAEAIAVSAHKRWFGYMAFVASIMAFAALSMAVWSHHMYVTGGVTNQYFAFTSTALLVPAGIEYFDMVGTLIGGSIVLRTSMLFALTFFIQFLIGGLSGIFVASPVLDYQAYGTYIVVAHFHYTLFAGSIFGFFAGVYHWFPKITGRAAARAARKAPSAADGGRHQPDVLPDVLPGQRRDAAASVAVPDPSGVGHAQRDRDDRRRDHRARRAHVLDQRVRFAAPSGARG